MFATIWSALSGAPGCTRWMASLTHYPIEKFCIYSEQGMKSVPAVRTGSIQLDERAARALWIKAQQEPPRR